MKKFSIIFTGLALSALVFLSGCKKTETDPPTLRFEGGNTSLSVEVGGIFNIVAIMNAATDVNLKKLAVTKSTGGISQTTNYDLSGNSANKTITDTLAAGVETLTYKFLVTDSKDKTAEATFTVNKKVSVYKPIQAINSLQLQNQNNTGEQFASLLPNSGTLLGIQTFIIADAKKNSPLIDLCYGSATTSGNFIAAPSSQKAKLIYDNTGMDKLSTWTTLNSTVFKKTSLTIAEFNAVSNDSAIIMNADGIGMSTEITNIASDMVVSFIARNKKGLLLIRNASGTLTTAGSVTLEWKIQE